MTVNAEKEDESLESSNESLFSKFRDTLDKRNPNTLGYNMPVISIKWYPSMSSLSSVLLFAHVNGYVGLLDRDTMKKLIIVEEKDELACIDICLDGSIMALVGKDTSLKLYDTNFSSKILGHKLKEYGSKNMDFEDDRNSTSTHTSRLQCVKFSNCSSDVLFTGGWDRTVKIWDTRTANGVVNTIYGPFICGSDAIDVKVSQIKYDQIIRHFLQCILVLHDNKVVYHSYLQDFLNKF